MTTGQVSRYRTGQLTSSQHVSPAIIDNAVVFGALCGAISWNIITWWFGIPSSSSHALVGGLVGAALAKAGWAAIVAQGLIKTSAAIILSIALLWILPKPPRIQSSVRLTNFNFSLPLCTASVMAAMMPRKPWGSSQCCCFPMAICRESSMSRSAW